MKKWGLYIVIAVGVAAYNLVTQADRDDSGAIVDAGNIEAFAVFDVDVASFPGDDEIADLAFDACLERFEPFVGRDYESSSLDVYALYPTQDSWNHHNDREVVCAVFDMEANKLTGSVAGLSL